MPPYLAAENRVEHRPLVSGALEGAVVSVRREKTAIRRHACSRPVALAIGHGLITPERSVLDYGCGHGADVRFLKSKKVVARGWDPHYSPDNRALSLADVVNLGYVLNVIESPAERAETLHRAFGLADRLLVVAVRVDREIGKAFTYADGVLTSNSTFQKLYDQAEFLRYLQTELGIRPHAAALGVALVFKDQQLEAEYVASQAFAGRASYTAELLYEFRRDTTARKYVALANRLGRVPLPVEFKPYSRLLERYGSPIRLKRLLLRTVDENQFAAARAQRREDVLTYLAMLRLLAVKSGPSQLPTDLREDMKAYCGSYALAKAEAESFLFSLGKPERVASACASSSVGKLLPRDFYVHRTAEEELPPLLRLLVFAAKQVVGDVDYELLKLSTDGRAVSFLAYQDFETDPHPALVSSIRIYLPKSEYDIRDYRDSLNPAILHRKDTLVSEAHPLKGVFQALTREEEELGLLSHPDIGYRRQWCELLASRGLRLNGHALTQHSPNGDGEKRG